ncbi:hypothetical protein Misp03_31340 [Microbispora sp. NBRC 16548]|nr:hypothetical protein Misp03_31340 [Microbispora sp. NBRC 16548]
MVVQVNSRIVNTFHRLGGALGVAVLSTVAADGTTGVTPAFAVGAVVAPAAAALSAFAVPAGAAPAGAAPHAPPSRAPDAHPQCNEIQENDDE